MRMLIVLGIAFVLTTTALFAGQTSIVVLDFVPLNKATYDDGKDIADNIRLMFHGVTDAKGNFSYDQENYNRMKKAVTAAEMADLNLRELNDLVRLGKAYPVEYLVAGSVSNDGEGKYYLTAEYIDVTNGELVQGFAMDGSSLRAMTSQLIADMSGAEDFSVLFPEGTPEKDDTEYSEFRNVISIIASPEELAIYDILSSRGKSLFLDKFWTRRDTYPDTPENEFKEQFLTRVAYSEKKFETTFKKGYVTDRGEVYIRYGEPDEIEDRSLGVESVHSFEETEWQSTAYVAWKYYGKSEKKGKPALFVFEDKTGDGDYLYFASTETGYGNYIANYQEFDLNRLEVDPFDTTSAEEAYWDESYKTGELR
ncbi:MAG: GWxTD domain-containing protein [bacterium]|nr:GWxTD domain-containing protein [bacterium]